MHRIWKNYNLSIVLFALFFVSSVLYGVFLYPQMAQEAAEHGQTLAWSDFWIAYGAGWFENAQSEFLQLFTFVVLATYLIHRDSPQSRDSDDRMEAKIDTLLGRVDKLQQKQRHLPPWDDKGKKE